VQQWHNLSKLKDIPNGKAADNSTGPEVPNIKSENNGIQFYGGECTVRTANRYELREKAYKLLHKIYLKMGIVNNNSNKLWLSIYDALPETTTLISEDSKGKIGGALTLVFDSHIGLPADELYKEEIDEIRKTGGQICEFISLGTRNGGKASLKIIAGLFYCAFLHAWQRKKTAILVITVHSRLEKFYCRKLSFEKIGPERNYAKVNGEPTVLLCLSLDKINKLRHKARIFPFSMLDCSDEKEIQIAEKIKNMVQPMSDEEFLTLFIEKTDTWEKASNQQKEFIKKAYPNDKINHYEVSRALARTFSRKNGKSEFYTKDSDKIVHR
jgi:hypothetical protein